MRFVFALAVILNLTCAHAAPTEGLAPGDTITGKLQIVRARHPNGTRIVAYQVVSETRRSFDDKFCVNEDGAETFHLVVANGDEEKRLKALRNKPVSVIVNEFSCSQTAWHIGDAVVFKWRLAN